MGLRRRGVLLNCREDSLAVSSVSSRRLGLEFHFSLRAPGDSSSSSGSKSSSTLMASRRLGWDRASSRARFCLSSISLLFSSCNSLWILSSAVCSFLVYCGLGVSLISFVLLSVIGLCRYAAGDISLVLGCVLNVFTVVILPLDAMNLCIRPLGGVMLGDVNLRICGAAVVLMLGAESFLLRLTEEEDCVEEEDHVEVGEEDRESRGDGRLISGCSLDNSTKSESLVTLLSRVS